jgi:hypothetical protein
MRRDWKPDWLRDDVAAVISAAHRPGDSDSILDATLIMGAILTSVTDTWRPTQRIYADIAPISDGLVYFVRAVGSADDLGREMFKIGFTSGDANSRVSQFKTGCPYHVEIVHVSPGSMSDEHDLHRAIVSRRLAGEWFSLTIDEVDRIEWLLRRGAMPAVCPSDHIYTRGFACHECNPEETFW